MSYHNKFFIISILLGSATFFVSFNFLSISLYERVLVSLSVATFVLYGFDKFMAINKSDRVPEVIFYLLIMSGGFIGGWAGMILFRHKKRKQAFIMVLLLATLAHGYLYFFRPLF